MTDTSRLREQREVQVWQKAGWVAEASWKEARPIAPGKTVWKRRDFFAAFDIHAVHPRFERTAWVQVTESRFARTDGSADRNAFHGEPPWDLRTPGATVDAFMQYPELGPAIVQVIVSYAVPRKPERRWWFRKGGAACPVPKDPTQASLDDFEKKKGRKRLGSASRVAPTA